MKGILKYIIFRNTFRKYRNTLPKTSEISSPKMEYNVFADGVAWEDEGLFDCDSDLGNAFRSVIHYRTGLITGNTEGLDKRYFELARKYFPDWIGFNEDRCSYNAEHADRIRRIRKVSSWKMDKFFGDD